MFAFKKVIFVQIFILLCLSVSNSISTSVKISLIDVPEFLIQSAMSSLNENSPIHHTYKSSNLIGAQKSVDPPFTTYKLTLNVEPTSNADATSREICTVKIKQHDYGAIIIDRNFTQCVFQDVIDNLERQVEGNSKVIQEVQTLPDQNDRPFIAVPASTSNYCPGCPYDLNPNLPGLSIFGEAIVSSMDESLSSDFKHKVISVLRVSRSVPPNANIVRYEILLEIGETNCLKTSLLERSQCSPQSNLPIRICQVTIEEEPWLENSHRITKNNCTETSLENELNSSLSNDMEKRIEVLGTGNRKSSISGGEEEQRTEFYDQVAQEGKFSTYETIIESPTVNLKVEGNDGMVKTISIERPEREADLQNNDTAENLRNFAEKMKDFDGLLKDFDILITEMNSTTEDERIPVTEEILKEMRIESAFESEEKFNESRNQRMKLIRVRKSTRTKNSEPRDPILGGLSKKDVNDPEIIQFVNLGLKKYSQNLQSPYEPIVAEVTDASVQVVAGLLYRIKVKFGTSTCPKGFTENCKLQSSGKMEECLIKVWSRAWIDNGNPEITVDCQLDRKKRALRGENYSQKMLKLAKEIEKEEESGSDDTSSSESRVNKQEMLNKFSKTRENLTDDEFSNSKLSDNKNYNQKMLRLNEEIKGDRSQIEDQEILEDLAVFDKVLNEYKMREMFYEFQKKYQRKYHDYQEENKRFQIFMNNLKKIEQLEKYEQGTAKYGVTVFADLTYEEFKSHYLGLKPELRSENEIPLPMAKIPDINLPKEFDWRKGNAVTEVKNQGQCGSCWAFSVTGNVEGQYAIKYGKLLSFSEQELVDCDKLDDGCNGGLPDSAYRAIENLGGLELESDYPYDAEDETCHFNKSKVRAKIVSAVNITSNETQIAQWLVENGPISIGINANAMQFYIGGVSHPPKFLCNPKNLDHGVLIIGYGVHTYPIFKKTIPYWIIKNSWGPRWGEQGYYRVYRGGSTCGVNQMASSATIE